MANTIVANGGTANLPTTNELPVDMWKKQLTSYVSLTPLTRMLAKLNEDPAHNFRVDLIEQNEIPTTVTIAQGESSVSTTVYVVEYGTTLVQDTLLFNPRAMDIRKVSATPGANTVTVTTSQGGTTAATWNAGDVVHVLPPAIPEDDDLSTFRATSVQNTNIYNYIQVTKMQYSLTRTMNHMSTHFGGPGSVRQSLKAQKYREFRIKKEKQVYFGGRASSGTAPATTYMAGGLRHYLYNGTLFKNFNGILTESAWDNYLGDYHDQNPDVQRVDAFIAPQVHRLITYWGKPLIRLSPDSKKYGLAIDMYKGPGLEVNLHEMPLMTDAETKGWGFILNPEYIRMKPLQKDAFFPEAQNVGESENIIDTYYGSHSMLIGSEFRHSMFTGAKL